MRPSSLAFAFALALALAACGSGTDATGPTTANLANGSMSATIDGTKWTATASVRASSQNGIVGVAGTDVSQTLTFALAASGPGTYAIGLPSAANAELTSGANVWSAAGNIGGGTITITSLSATAIAGSFSFTLMKGGTSKSVTNGAFNIKF